MKIEDLIKDAAKISESANKAIKEVDRKVKEKTTPQEYNRYRAFLKKYTKLMQEGKFGKAAELAKEYGNEGQNNG